MASWDWVTNGSCDVLLLNSTWPLSEPVLTKKNKLKCKDLFRQILFEKKLPSKEMPFKCQQNVGYFVQASLYKSAAFGSHDFHCAGFKQYIFHQCVFQVRHLISNDFQCWRSVIEPEIYLRWFGPVHCGARGDTQWGPELWNGHIYVNHHDQKYLFIYFIFLLFELLLFVCCVMSCHVGNKIS